MPEKPVILKKSTIAASRLFRVEELEITFSNGEQRTFERLARGRSNGAVLVVPMLDNETVLLIREYSAGVDRYELGLPKGRIDAGESMFAAANRELKEEIGYGARFLHHLTSLSIAPQYMQHMTDIIIAMDLYPEKLKGDEPEELEVVPWKLSQLQRLLTLGECTEARSIAALFMTIDYLNNRISKNNAPEYLPGLSIRKEVAGDADAIAAVIKDAFLDHPHSNQQEHRIVLELRKSGNLSVSLVAEADGQVVGYVAFSPVTISDHSSRWYGLGPLAVNKAWQRRGIGKRLVETGLSALRELNANGCVVLGYPEFYQRFGFVNHEGLRLADYSAENFLALTFAAPLPSGEVIYHEAFSKN